MQSSFDAHMVPFALQPKLLAVHGDEESWVSTSHLSTRELPAAASEANIRPPNARVITIISVFKSDARAGAPRESTGALRPAAARRVRAREAPCPGWVAAPMPARGRWHALQ